MRRTFRGRAVKRTCAIGNQVKIIFKAEQKGRPGDQMIVPVEEYAREIKKNLPEESRIKPNYSWVIAFLLAGVAALAAASYWLFRN